MTRETARSMGAAPVANSNPSAVAVAQRRSVTHEPCAAVPTKASGLTRVRTADSVAPTRAQRASANPIADAVYSRRAKSSRGTTSMHAPHDWHSYRRARTLVSSGTPPAVGGPRT